MSSRSLAIASASLVLSIFAAGCGGDDEAVITSSPSDGGSPSASVTTPDASTPSSTGTDDPTSSSDLPDANTPGVDSPQSDAAAKNRTVADTIAADTDLQSLKTALGAAGLSTVLEQPGPYTVFAPTNDAFAKLGSKLDTLLQPSSKRELSDLLKFHVVRGEVKMEDLKDGQLLTTLQGTRLRVSKEGSQVGVGNSQGKATVVTSDIPARNGLVQTIDSVLTPKKPK